MFSIQSFCKTVATTSVFLFPLSSFAKTGHEAESNSTESKNRQFTSPTQLLPQIMSLKGYGGWGDSTGKSGKYQASLQVSRTANGVELNSLYEGEDFNENFTVELEPSSEGFNILKEGTRIGSGSCSRPEECTMVYVSDTGITETLFLQGKNWLRFGQKQIEGKRIFWFEVLGSSN
jgi:hypothetical protein